MVMTEPELSLPPPLSQRKSAHRGLERVRPRGLAALTELSKPWAVSSLLDRVRWFSPLFKPPSASPTVATAQPSYARERTPPWFGSLVLVRNQSP